MMTNGKLCEKCGETLEICENCEISVCAECDPDLYMKWGQDINGCEFCPECIKMLDEEWKRETKDGTEVCGTCSLFSDEDTEGEGWCEFHQESKRCKEYCENRLPNTEPNEPNRH